VVVIENPVGSRYTSLKRARDLVKRGYADFTDAGTLVLSHVQQAMLSAAARAAEERAILAGRAVIFWNGSDKHPLAMHEPGQVRS
jgi:hypothetical protein